MTQRGWCPSLFTPMPTGDGLLLRLKPRAGVLTAAAAQRLADLAERHGNGLIELTARANLQLRGCTARARRRSPRRPSPTGLVMPIRRSNAAAASSPRR